MSRLRGSFKGRVDEKGRLKIPANFKQAMEGEFGAALYITTRDPNTIRVYPLPVWEASEDRLDQNIPSTDPDREIYDLWMNYYGGEAEMDKQGRALIPQMLRETFTPRGEVVVVGMGSYLLVGTREHIETMLTANPLTRTQLASLSSRGV